MNVAAGVNDECAGDGQVINLKAIPAGSDFVGRNFLGYGLTTPFG